MPNQPPTVIPVGTIIDGKYRVERHVGDGGMGMVVAARHLVLKELYAIKFMHHRDLANPQAAARFVREAQAVVKLKNNEHVARVHDVGKHETGDLYIVMELLVGQDLGDVLKTRGVLPIRDACSYILQACNALVEAHELGIIHRDLKPANLFLTRRKDGSSCIKVLDFGISKVLSGTGNESEIEMTGTRETMGSPLYMSPEQAKSARDVDSRTDIWALGAILYKLLTGKAPFACATFAEITFALVEDTPARPPSEIRRDIPRALEACILRCLEKNIHRRYARVTDLMAALAPFAEQKPAPPEDDDNAATVFRPIGRNQSSQECFGGTIPLNAAQIAHFGARQAKARQERSGTDVMPSYQASAGTREDLMQGPPSAPNAQTTQPIDARALHAISNQRRAAERKPGFTGRINLPPAISPMPNQPLVLPWSTNTPIPAIMPPPIPPAYPSGKYPLAPAASVTLQSGMPGNSMPSAPAVLHYHGPPRQTAPSLMRRFGPIALATIVIVGLCTVLVMRSLAQGSQGGAPQTPSATTSAKPPNSTPAPSASGLLTRAKPNAPASTSSTNKGSKP